MVRGLRSHYKTTHSCFFVGQWRECCYNKRMAKKSTPTPDLPQPFIVTHKAASIKLLALIIFIGSAGMWITSIYNAPARVFNGMLSNNLSTESVTRVSNTSNNGVPVEKYEQISFVPQAAARTVINIDQRTSGGDSKVMTETVGTQAADFSRYLVIETSQKNDQGKALDYSSVKNLWGKGDSTSGPPQYYQQAVLGLVPFANLNDDDRQKVLKAITEKKAYTVDYSKVAPKKVGKYAALVFPVKVDTAGYIEVLKVLGKSIGLGDLADLDPAAYKDAPPIELSLVVDKASRQLIELDYVGSDQKETYTSYGLSAPVVQPTKTISVDELQQKVQSIR